MTLALVGPSLRRSEDDRSKSRSESERWVAGVHVGLSKGSGKDQVGEVADGSRGST